MTKEETAQLDTIVRRIAMDPQLDWYTKRRLLEGATPMGPPLSVRIDTPNHSFRAGSMLSISADCFADPECTILHTRPIIADAGGNFPPIYFKAPVV